MKQTILFSIFLGILTIKLFSQTEISSDGTGNIITRQFLSIENGLASREVICGLMDNEGFMWLGTRAGLNRYDGNKFTLLTTKNGLKTDYIGNLAKDNRHHLFITYTDYDLGVQEVGTLNLKTLATQKLSDVFPQMPFKSENVIWLTNDNSPNLYFIVKNPLRLWKYTESKGFELICEMKAWWEAEKAIIKKKDMGNLNNIGFHCAFKQGYVALHYDPNHHAKVNGYFITPDSTYSIPPSIRLQSYITTENQFIYSIEQDSYDSYQLTDKGQTQKISSFYPDKQMTFNPHRYEPPFYVAGKILAHIENKGLFFISDKGSQSLIDEETWRKYGNPLISQCFEDNYGNIWLCTYSGLIKLRVEKNRFTHYFADLAKKSTDINSVRDIYVDNNGKVYANIWIDLVTSEDEIIESPTAEVLYGLCFHEGKIYDTSTGLYVVSDVQKSPKTNSQQPTAKRQLINILEREATAEIWTITAINTQELLLGSADKLYKFVIQTGEQKPCIYASPDIPRVAYPYRFMKTQTNERWAIAQSGIYKLNEQADSILEYWGNIPTKTNRQNPTANSQQPAANSQQPNIVHAIPCKDICDVYQDKEGIFWIATATEGLFRWNKKENSFRQFKVADGLSTNILYRIEGDEYGNLWIGTNYGLIRFNTHTFFIQTYTTQQGLTHNEFNRISSFKAADGKLYFGGMNGVNVFDPKDFQEDAASLNAPLLITKFSQFSGTSNEIIDKTTQLITENKIILQPSDKFFTIEFQLLDFEEKLHHYAYKIEGIDKDWIYINENSVHISALPYGDFTLQIKGQNIQGNWSDKVLTIPIKVVRPFYLELWFILLSVVIIIAIIAALIRYRFKGLQRDKQRLENEVAKQTAFLQQSLVVEKQLVGEKEVLLREVHHRVKNNLQVISGLLELQSKTLTDTAAIEALMQGRNRIRSVALMHQNLYQFENFSAIEVNKFIEDLFKQLSHMFEKRDKMMFSTDIPFTEIDIDTAVPLGLILNELFTNSFKYAFTATEKPSITISLHQTLEEDGRIFTLTYHDNGIGLPEGFDLKKAKTLGIRLIYDLTKQLKGQVKYRYEDGSTFVITFKDKAARKSID